MKKNNIEQLVIKTKIGNYVENIEKVNGGLSHRMYKVTTDKGIYAVKELNSVIMKRKDAYSNFVFSEKVVDIAKKNDIKAVSSLKVNGDIITKVNDNYYMIFKWLEGKILKAEEITLKHCQIIGNILAKIHNIDFSTIEDEKRKKQDAEEFNWNKYIELSNKQNKPYFKLLEQNVELLYNLNKKSIEALNYAKNNLTISHTDLDRKNVMWKGNIPYIIDWEASGYINPTIELIQVAWYWSGGDVGNIDYTKYKKIIEGYKKQYKGKIDKNIDKLIYADNYSGLAWLNYNLERSLCLKNNYERDEVELAEKEVIQSMKEIIYNASQFEYILEVIKSF